MGLLQALTGMLWMLVPAAVYGIVLRVRWRVRLREIAERLGLTIGPGRFYLLAIAVTVAFLPLLIWFSQWTSTFQGSLLAPFVGASPSAENIGRVVNYGLLATGLPEELLFRGLIAGALFRRLGFWTANWLQAVIFLLPHLLILLVAPRIWPLVIASPLGFGLLAGWLRQKSGSIGPSVIIHAVSNIAEALWVMNWRG
jgi:membrane protease YdiL (CAAX protease family)